MSDPYPNLLKNADFARGTRKPAQWRWQPSSGRASWRRIEQPDPPGVCVQLSAGGVSEACRLLQTRPAKPHAWYELSAWLLVEAGRATLELTALRQGRPIKRLAESVGGPPGQWHFLRVLFSSPAWTEQLVASVAHEGHGHGRARSIRLVKTQGPESCGHLLNLPVDPSAYPPPCLVRRVVVLTDGPQDNRLAQVLRARMGKSAVSVRSVGAWSNLSPVAGQAVVIDSSRKARPIPTWNSLKRLADQTIVVTDLETLVAAANRPEKVLHLGRVTQDHEPLHGRIRWAGHVTIGLSLEDVVPLYRIDGEGRYFQRFIKRSRPQRRFFADQQVTAAVTNEGLTDAVSQHPLVVTCPGRRGMLVSLDLGVFRDPPSRLPQVEPWTWLLINALGLPQAQVGQFVFPEFLDHRLEQSFKDLLSRFSAVSGRVEGTSSAGRAVRSFGIGRRHDAPLTLLVAGLEPGDWPAVYSCLLLLKRVGWSVEQGGHVGRAMLAGGNIKAIPLLCPDGWETHNRHVRGIDLIADLLSPVPELAESRVFHEAVADPRVSGVICLTATAEPTGWIHVAGEGRLARAARTTTPVWLRRHLAGRFVNWKRNRTTGQWIPATDRSVVRVRPAAERWQLRLAELISRRGKDAVMVAAPGRGDLTGMGSLPQTDRLVSIGEHLLGLRGGLMFANRLPAGRRVRLPVLPGSKPRITVVDAGGRMVQSAETSKLTETDVTLAPGACLIVETT